MPKTDGYKTRKKILEAAEQLFAEKGFDGTSIQKIAKAAEVNKGLIYYHFKDKNDIVISIFRNMIQEINEAVNLAVNEEHQKPVERGEDLQNKIRKEIEYCMSRKRIIAVMLMESLKNDDKSNFLYKCAEIVIHHELDSIRKKVGTAFENTAEMKQRYMIHEFFTGFIPMVMFVALQENYGKYFNCDKNKALDYFLDAFSKTHLLPHLNTRAEIGREGRF